MSNVRYFSSVDEFRCFCKEQRVKRLGFGSEGNVYLTKDNQALKIFLNNIIDYDYKKIITADMVDSKYFLFPEELYVVNEKLCGYKTKVILQDYFYDLIEPQKYIKLYSNKLEEAIIRFKEEFERIDNLGIYMYDLPGNIMYDGNNIYAIDTCSYTFETDAKDKNNGTFDYTIETTFNPLIEHIIDNKEDFISLDSNDISSYLFQICLLCVGEISKPDEKKNNDSYYREEYQKLKQKIIMGSWR